MWSSYPEEPVTYCRRCELDIPIDYYWRGRGFIISGDGGQERTPILYSLCPECGQRYSVALEGGWAYRVFYGWLWRLRYPYTRPPVIEPAVREQPRRRASG